MSEPAAATAPASAATAASAAASPARPDRAAPRAAGRSRRPRPGTLALVAVLVVAAILPLYVGEFWLRCGFAIFGAAVGAIGLNLLTGTTGQLSLGHAFFLAVGAVTYCYAAGHDGGGATKISGLGLSPLLAMVLAVVVSGLAGLLFSPIAARLRGIYLGVASLGLVFIGQQLLSSQTAITGGFNGRSAPEFVLFGFHFADHHPDLSVLNVPFNQPERLWYLGLALLLASAVFAANLLRSRPGRALTTLRDSEIAAAVMGVNVQGYKARAFLLSSMYAGLSGVLLALSIGSVSPESFGLDVSVQYLAMIVLGGLGSVVGAVLGAAFVSALPLVLQQYASSLPLVVPAGEKGISPSEAARYLYGIAIIAIVLFEPAGLVGLGRRVLRLGRGPSRSSGSPYPPLSPTVETQETPV